MNYYICSDSNFLAHHGVKGMKWGVRRYQNYDGTRIGAKSSTGSIKKTTNKYEYDYSQYGGEKGTVTETKYSHRSSSGKKAFDSAVDKELQENTRHIRENFDPDYKTDVRDITGGDLARKIDDEGMEFVHQVIHKGQEQAEKWLQESSALKDYDYELTINKDTEVGEDYVTATLRIIGNKYDYKVGVEEDYSDDAYYIDKNREKRRKEAVTKVESSKEYRALEKRMQQIQKEMDKIESDTPKGKSRFDNDRYNELDDEWYEISEKQNKLKRKALGDDW